MTQPSTLQLTSAVIFGLAILHTFCGSVFNRLAIRHPRHEGALHLLGEVEVVFGVWALILLLIVFIAEGEQSATGYLDSRSFNEPLFVFAVMVVAGSRPVLRLSRTLVLWIAQLIPVSRPVAVYFATLALLPLMGSMITEPGAMTLAALLLKDRVFAQAASQRLKYVTIGTLFVNVSIGGTVTSFAAPPVLMVAAKWGWDLPFMLTTFGWRAAAAVFVNAAAVAFFFGKEIAALPAPPAEAAAEPVPAGAMAASAAFLLGIVLFAHHPPVFMGLLLFFIGYSAAYPRHHDPLILREALLVAFFLSGLVVLGGMQQWWLQRILTAMTPTQVYFGATALTAVTDNAALTYLGSLVDGLSDEFKVSLVAGAVSGGGLTLIANAPNPAGYAILKDCFRDGTVAALPLFLSALAPTIVVIVAFQVL